jgi:hypothetical protein
LHFPQNLNLYERKRRVRHIRVPITALIASMQSITHQLSFFGQNDGGIFLAAVFKFVVAIAVRYIELS